MTRAILLILALTLSGCAPKVVAITPDPVAMPALPAPLSGRAEPLPPIVGNDLKTVLRDGVASDRAYNDLRYRYNAVLDAWECVRSALSDGHDAGECLK